MRKKKGTDIVDKPRGRRIFIVPALFTTANIFAGFYAIVASFKGYQVIQTDWVEAARFFDNAAKAIGWAVLFDMLDGRIARMTNATSDFGVELDSLADLVSFGIAPAVLAYTWGFGSSPPAYWAGFREVAWAVSFIYLMCGAFRLARFNVHSRRPAIEVKMDRKQFIGLPIPAAAGLIAALIHFVRTPVLASQTGDLKVIGTTLVFDGSFWSLALILLVLSLSLLMISSIRHTSFKSFGFKGLSPRLTLLVMSILVWGIYFYSQWVLLILATGYASHGLIVRGLGRIVRSRRQEHSLHEVATEESK